MNMCAPYYFLIWIESFTNLKNKKINKNKNIYKNYCFKVKLDLEIILTVNNLVCWSWKINVSGFPNVIILTINKCKNFKGRITLKEQ